VSIRAAWRRLARLTRVRLSFFVALSAATGHAAAAYRLSWEMLVPAAGCILLAGGSSALNQYQERGLDALMRRTRSRPIPAGEMHPRTALLVSLALIGAGLALLGLLGGTWAALFGALAILLYNGLYTWMKRWSAFAAVPGAVIGGLGPAIGWVSGGGEVTSSALLAIFLVFYLWQVPHFWLLSLNFPDDYRAAGLPDPVAVLGRDRLFRLVVVWSTCTAFATLLLPLFGLLHSLALYLILCASALSLALLLFRTQRRDGADQRRFRVGFAGINFFVLVTMLLLIVESGL
jgi:protoheme IX farnesyltransferase